MIRNVKGFLLVEALLVSTLVSMTVLLVFTQFKAVYRSYEISFKFNTVNEILVTSNLKGFLNETILASTFTYVDNNKYIEIGNCSASYINNTNLCTSLFSALNISEVYLVTENISSFIDYVTFSPSFSQNFVDFVNYVDYGDVGYRVIIRFNDDRFATLNLK